MFAVLYRWRVADEDAAAFVHHWELATEAIRDRCSSFGSRLHRTDDGEWVAYARWPNEQAWRDCSRADPIAALEPMLALIEDPDGYPPLRMTIESDLLSEPGSTASGRRVIPRRL